jgi:hypothetical protein
MADELRDCANRVVEEHLGEVSTSIPAETEPTIAFLQQRLIESDSSLAVRFVILNFLYRLAHFAGFGLKESEREVREAVWPHLETFVGLQEVSEFNDPRAIRWEIAEFLRNPQPGPGVGTSGPPEIDRGDNRIGVSSA